MSKMKVDKDVFFCKICIKAKQKYCPSYKISYPPEDISEELHVDLIGLITPTGQNGHRYTLTITDGYSKCQQVKNIHEKRKAELYLTQFVIFIENQTGKNVKRLRLNQDREFGVQELDFQTKESEIKIELTIVYSPEINGIAKRTNGLVAFKARCLLFDAAINIGQSFWLEAFSTAIYLLNRSLSTFPNHDCRLAVQLRVYNSTNENYIPDLSYIRTFGCRMYTKIPDEK